MLLIALILRSRLQALIGLLVSPAGTAGGLVVPLALGGAVLEIAARTSWNRLDHPDSPRRGRWRDATALPVQPEVVWAWP